MSDPVLDHLIDGHDGTLNRLVEYARIPSVSTNAASADGMAAARKLLTRRLMDCRFYSQQSQRLCRLKQQIRVALNFISGPFPAAICNAGFDNKARIRKSV